MRINEIEVSGPINGMRSSSSSYLRLTSRHCPPKQRTLWGKHSFDPFDRLLLLGPLKYMKLTVQIQIYEKGHHCSRTIKVSLILVPLGFLARVSFGAAMMLLLSSGTLGRTLKWTAGLFSLRRNLMRPRTLDPFLLSSAKALLTRSWLCMAGSS